MVGDALETAFEADKFKEDAVEKREPSDTTEEVGVATDNRGAF